MEVFYSLVRCLSEMSVSETRKTIFGYLQLAAIVAVFLVAGEVPGYRIVGIFVVAHGFAAAWSESIPVGIKGKEPSFYLKGSHATIAGIGMIILGALIIWLAPELVCALSKSRLCS